MSGNSNQPLLTIRCLTYNHELYIRQCLDGFVMQRTNFPFEAVVHDDASTDGTATIIREYAVKYPNIIKPILEIENQYSKRDGSLGKIIQKHMHGKYIAMCEGDDYWTDPLKLQKQVDFLESHPDYGMCYTRVEYFSQKDNKLMYIWGKKRNSGKELIEKGNVISTLSVVFRKDLYERYLQDVHPELHNWKMGDYPIWIWFSFQSRIKFFSDVTGVYRVLESSASHSRNIQKVIEFAKSGTDIRMFFAKKFYPSHSKILKKIREQYILSLYKIIVKYDGDINEVRKEIEKIDFFSWKIVIMKVALKNTFIRSCLSHYYGYG